MMMMIELKEIGCESVDWISMLFKRTEQTTYSLIHEEEEEEEEDDNDDGAERNKT
jgi:hypothetical protein